MTIPVMIIVVLLTKFVLETMLLRHENAIYTRGSVVRAAELTTKDTVSQLTLNATRCWHDKSDIGLRNGVSRNVRSICRLRLAENALPEWRRFGRVVHDAARHKDMIRSLDFLKHPHDIEARGYGSISFSTPPFLSRTSGDKSGHRNVRPTTDFWTYNDPKWANAHDKALWSDLRPFGLYGGPQWLFPEVFPARGR